MVQIAKMDCLPSIKHRIQFYAQAYICDDFPELEKLTPVSIHKLKILAYLMEDPEKMAELANDIGSFLQNAHVYVLVLLFTLTKDSPYLSTQGWNKYIKRILFKQLRLLCGTHGVGQCFNNFCNQVLAYKKLSENFMEAMVIQESQQ